MNDIEAIKAACKEIRRWAPTQTHAVRRAMFRIADMFDGKGFNLNEPDNMLFVSVPIYRDGEVLCYADVSFGPGYNREPDVRLELRVWDEQQNCMVPYEPEVVS